MEKDETLLTLEEKEELEALRKEKRHTELKRAAKEGLKKYGVSEDFADFAIGDTEETTLERARLLCERIVSLKEGMAEKYAYSPMAEKPCTKPHRGVRRL